LLRQSQDFRVTPSPARVTSETVQGPIGKRVLAGLDPVDGILGLGAF
jgi:hypothetical protein